MLFYVLFFRSCDLCAMNCFGHTVMPANNVAADEEWTLVLRILSSLPSLNSPGSNLQTAAKFWQFPPWCPLPLGDTFLFFPSLLFWYSLHGALGPSSYCQFCSPSMSEKPNGFTGFTVNLSLFSGLMNVAQSSISSLLFPPHPFMMTWSFFLL